MNVARERAGDWEGRESTSRRSDLIRYQRESALLARMQRMAGIGGWEIDLLSHSLTWTAETYRIHEVTPAAYSPSLDSAINFYVPEHAPILRAAITRAIVLGKPYDLEAELITGQGRRIWVRAIGQVEMRAGRPRRVFGLVQDITERRRIDREILEIEREDGARTVSSLRDDLGQSLAGMSLMLRSLADRTQDPALSREADQLVVLMNRAIGSCRALAKEISPVSEAHGGLIRAVRELAQAYGQARGVTATVRSHGKLPVLLDEPSASHLYKIAQSAIARVLQATGISHLAVTINSTPDTVTLAASADGAAIGEDDPKAAGELSILHRRAEVMGAILKIEPVTRGGERITCTVHVPTTRCGPNLLEQPPALASPPDSQV